MTEVTNYKYHSTGQFRQTIRHITTMARFDGIDEEGNAKYDNTRQLPKLGYIGTEKIHGTNCSIVLHDDGVISFHSKTNLLGFVKDGEFILNTDNYTFAQEMWLRFDAVKEITDKAKNVVKELYGDVVYPIKISGEWFGKGIQNAVGVSYLPYKAMAIFGIKAGETNQDSKSGWLPVTYCSDIVNDFSSENHIYAITDFPTKTIVIDFEQPEYTQDEIIKYVEDIENNSGVAKQLGVKDQDGNDALLGEGYVWTPTDIDLCWDTGTWFKTKGEKHSVTKVKKLAAVDIEKLESVNKFVEYAVTENRLQQALEEVGLDQKSYGKFIKWMTTDVFKEESDTMKENNLTCQDVGRAVTKVAAAWYTKKLKEN